MPLVLVLVQQPYQRHLQAFLHPQPLYPHLQQQQLPSLLPQLPQGLSLPRPKAAHHLSCFHLCITKVSVQTKLSATNLQPAALEPLPACTQHVWQLSQPPIAPFKVSKQAWSGLRTRWKVKAKKHRPRSDRKWLNFLGALYIPRKIGSRCTL